MSRRTALTPIEQVAESLTPNQVTYQITVVWPDGESSAYVADKLPLDRAAERLELLAEELREAAKVQA